jgi:hypothetical protein
MSKAYWNRRRFLKSAAGGLLLPMMPSLLPRAEAAAAKPPLRFIAIFHPLSFISEAWYPRRDLAGLNTIASNVAAKPMSQLGSDLPPILSCFAGSPLLNKVSLLRSLDVLHFSFHNSPTLLCAATHGGNGDNDLGLPATAGRSIDCLLEHSANFDPLTTSRPGLRIQEWDARYVSWYRPAGGRDANVSGGQSLYLRGNQTVFDNVKARFGSGTSTVSQTQTNGEKLMIDKVLAQFNAFMNRRSISSLERQHVQSHIDLVTELQKKIISAPAPAPAGGACTIPPTAAGQDGQGMTQVYRNYLDSIVASFSCDVSRIGVVQFGHLTDGGLPAGDQAVHDNSHRTAGGFGSDFIGNSAKWHGWIAQRVMELLAKLDSITEFDGSTMLDNTVVLWGSEMGDSSAHDSASVMAFLAGGKNAGFNQGNYIDFTINPYQYFQGNTANAPIGMPHAGLLVSIMRGLGMQPSEYLYQGDQGGLGQIDEAFVVDERRRSSFRNNPLPFLYTGS